MPRGFKRKANAPALAAIGEDENGSIENANTTLLAKKIEQIDIQASNAAGEIMAAASREAKGIRSEFEAHIKAVGKKIKDMPVSSYLMTLLSPSKKEADLSSMLSRLLSPLCAPRASTGTILAPESTSNPSASASHVEIDHKPSSEEEPEVKEPAKKKQKGNNGKFQEAAKEDISTEVAPAAASLSRRVTRVTQAPAVASTPLPTNKGRGKKGKAAAIPFPLATPSHNPLETPQAPAEAPSSAIMNTGGRLTGFSLMTRTAMGGGATSRRGGRRGGAAADGSELENAICISTYDGQQFIVDGEAGLANIPEPYKEEVAQQLEVMQRLVAAALKFK